MVDVEVLGSAAAAAVEEGVGEVGVAASLCPDANAVLARGLGVGGTWKVGKLERLQVGKLERINGG